MNIHVVLVVVTLNSLLLLMKAVSGLQHGDRLVQGLILKRLKVGKVVFSTTCTQQTRPTCLSVQSCQGFY